MEKVLFAFSGGIDDVLSVHWLRQTRGYSVLAFLADVGQEAHLETLGELAVESGAEGTIIVDLRARFIEDYIFPTLVSGAHYEGYLLSTALSRSLISEQLVTRAHEEGIRLLGHGGSNRGNDQVRFEAAVAALDPTLRIIAPLRELSARTHEDKLALLRRTHIMSALEPQEDVSMDRNLWGCGQVRPGLSDPWETAPEEIFVMTRNPRDAPDEPVEIVIGFEQGIPRSVNGDELDPITLIESLNQLAGIHGIGRLDHVENRMLGGKTREIYEAPGATLLYLAHDALEELTQSRDLYRYKRVLAEEYGNLVYNGLWFSELREALDRFFDATQRYVSGRVRLELYKGNAVVTGRESSYSLYDRSLTDPDGKTRFRDLARGYVNIVTQSQKSEAIHRRR